ncbi:MAG: hypothetical protein CMM77_08070 [Rhodospirillaceae bacterium]|nr:hypothetical protein [Magnetovibrio sp.]MAY67068.1 hypothetical protein [Rhodospirillaceae bacterium]|tara:strand:- start:407 stop:685 length:279 start_codon:yes stop_codon:yes gene_type:complete
MEFLILQSKKDPDFFIITDERNFDRAMQEYQDSQPGDVLTPVAEGAGGPILSSIPNLSVVKSFIDLIGYFGHAVEVPMAWPTPVKQDDAAAG